MVSFLTKKKKNFFFLRTRGIAQQTEVTYLKIRFIHTLFTKTLTLKIHASALFFKTVQQKELSDNLHYVYIS